jgi:hypothetical protein
MANTLREGEFVVVYFEDDNYLKFITGAFKNMLISGVQVQLEEKQRFKFSYLLFCTVAAPGIDRLADWIKNSGGEAILPQFNYGENE